jgi:hypothetical protein
MRNVSIVLADSGSELSMVFVCNVSGLYLIFEGLWLIYYTNVTDRNHNIYRLMKTRRVKLKRKFGQDVTKKFVTIRYK